MTSSSTHSPPLDRGKACLKCRTRKMRCDGVRPMCGPCARANEVECEYTDGGETPSQALQRRADYLQAQIRTLEGQSNQAIALHHPYREPGGNSSGRPNAHETEGQVSAALLPAFLSHAKNCGFFLNIRRFVEKLNPRTSGSPPLPSVLICAAQLVGTLFVQDARSKILEEQIFARVTQHLSVPSTQTDPANVVFLLQAEALIAFYHFYKNQVVQGYARATAAATQTFVWGLNTSQRARGAPAAGVLGRYHLPPPIDAIEAGERVNAFWTVFWMERCWSVAQGIQSMMFTQDNLTSVPWPLNMSDYEEGQMAHFAGTATMTVKTFLENQVGHESDRSLLSMVAKASILFERSADIRRNWAPGAPGFEGKFSALENQIDNFKRTLPSIPTNESPFRREGSPADVVSLVRSLLLIHTLVHCSTLHMYIPRKERDLSRSHAFRAASTASGILRRVDVRALGYVDPFMGVLWSSIIDALFCWLSGLRRARPTSAPGTSSSAQRALVHPFESNITTCLDCLTAAIATLAPRNPRIDEEYKKLLQLRTMPSA